MNKIGQIIVYGKKILKPRIENRIEVAIPKALQKYIYNTHREKKTIEKNFTLCVYLCSVFELWSNRQWKQYVH